MNTKLKIIAAPVIAAASIALALLGIGSASASTSGCVSGAFAGYCHVVTDQSSPGLSIDVFRQGAVAGNKVIGFTDSDGDKATDFLVFNRGNDVFFVYAPNGQPTDLSLSEPAKGSGVELRYANALGWQTYAKTPVFAVTFTPTGGTAAVAGYAVAGAVLPTSASGTYAFKDTSDSPASDGFILVNAKTGDVIQTNGNKAQLSGTTVPATGIYTANEVFNLG